MEKIIKFVNHEPISVNNPVTTIGLGYTKKCPGGSSVEYVKISESEYYLWTYTYVYRNPYRTYLGIFRNEKELIEILQVSDLDLCEFEIKSILFGLKNCFNNQKN